MKYEISYRDEDADDVDFKEVTRLAYTCAALVGVLSNPSVDLSDVLKRAWNDESFSSRDETLMGIGTLVWGIAKAIENSEW